MAPNANIYKRDLHSQTMINRPSESELLKLANIEIDEDTPLEDRVIYMHFFMDGCSWYMAEYDPESRRFFGYMIPGNKYHKARWDYFGFAKLCRMRGKIHCRVIRNTDWVPRRAIQVGNIRDAYAWKRNLERGLKRARRKISQDKSSG